MNKSITQLQEEEELLLATIDMLNLNLKNTQRELSVLRGDSRIPWRSMIMGHFYAIGGKMTTAELLDQFIANGLSNPVNKKRRRGYITGISVSIGCLCEEKVLLSHKQKRVKGLVYELNLKNK